jgi:hypothetical protein
MYPCRRRRTVLQRLLPSTELDYYGSPLIFAGLHPTIVGNVGNVGNSYGCNMLA